MPTPNVIFCASNDLVDVQAAVDSATYNDIVIMNGLADEVDWEGGTLTITKGITLYGHITKWNPHLSIADAPARILSSSCSIIIQPDQYTLDNEVPTRIEYLKFTYNGTSRLEGQNFIRIFGAGPTATKPYRNVIIKDCTFLGSSGDSSSGGAIFVRGHVNGVITNCTFDGQNMPFHVLGSNVISEWHNSAYTNFNFGTADALFFEANNILFTNNAATNWPDGADDGGVHYTGQGAKFVCRYNTFDYTNSVGAGWQEIFDIHGMQNWPGNGQTGTMVSEYYGNSIAGFTGFRAMNHRGGWLLMHNNTFAGTSTPAIQLNQYDVGDTGGSGCDEQSGATNPSGEVTNSYVWNNTVNAVEKNMVPGSPIGLGCGVTEGTHFFNYNADILGSTAVLPLSRTPGGRGSWRGLVGAQSMSNTRDKFGPTLASGTPLSTFLTQYGAAPPNSYIELGVGEFHWEGNTLTLTRPDITIRGQGMGATVIYLQTPGSYNGQAISLGDYRSWYCDGGVTGNDPTYCNAQLAAFNIKPILSGCVQGSTAVTVASAAGYSAGKLVVIDQINDAVTNGTVSTETMEPYQYSTVADWQRGQDRVLRQANKIVSVVGNTINLQEPLYYPNYSQNQSPTIRHYNETWAQTRGNGLESLTIHGLLRFHGASDCWFKDVEVINSKPGGDNGFIGCFYSVRCTVHGCKITSSLGTFDEEQYGFEARTSSGILVENNIFDWIGVALNLNGLHGSVLAYNLVNNVRSGGGVNMSCGMLNHQGWPAMVLCEGNIAPECGFDNTGGASWHNVVFRNWLPGLEILDFAAPDLTPRVLKNQQAIQVNAWNYSISAIGNVLGINGITYDSYQDGAAGCSDHPGGDNEDGFRIYTVGFSNGPCSGYDIDGGIAEDSFLRFYNFDEFTNAVVDGGVAAEDVPYSYYLSGKPAWFGNLVWPPIDPDDPVTSQDLNRIPAGYRYTHSNANPPAEATAALSGVGRGTGAPSAVATDGSAFWTCATPTVSVDSEVVQTGTLYKMVSGNWTPIYTPYTYPHPLTNGPTVDDLGPSVYDKSEGPVFVSVPSEQSEEGIYADRDTKALQYNGMGYAPRTLRSYVHTAFRECWIATGNQDTDINIEANPIETGTTADSVELLSGTFAADGTTLTLVFSEVVNIGEAESLDLQDMTIANVLEDAGGFAYFEGDGTDTLTFVYDATVYDDETPTLNFPPDIITGDDGYYWHGCENVAVVNDSTQIPPP